MNNAWSKPSKLVSINDISRCQLNRIWMVFFCKCWHLMLFASLYSGLVNTSSHYSLWFQRIIIIVTVFSVSIYYSLDHCLMGIILSCILTLEVFSAQLKLVFYLIDLWISNYFKDGIPVNWAKNKTHAS